VIADRSLQRAEMAEQRLARGGVDAAHHFAQPAFVRLGHVRECRRTALGEFGDSHAPVATERLPYDQAVGDQTLHEACDIAVGHHGALGELAEPQPPGLAEQLREQVELRQGRIELRAQAAPDLLRDQSGCRKQAKPQPELELLARLRALDDELEVCARLGGLVAIHLQVPCPRWKMNGARRSVLARRERVMLVNATIRFTHRAARGVATSDRGRG
jgi:hypothetical protein